jgi:hypothetical protein
MIPAYILFQLQDITSEFEKFAVKLPVVVDKFRFQDVFIIDTS